MKKLFVAREKEIAQLIAHLEKVCAGVGRAVFIAGEAGIGKTTLVEELISIAHTKGFKILRSICQKEVLTPYMAIKDALRYANLEHLISDELAPRVECVYATDKAGLLLAKYERIDSKLDATIFTAMLTAVSDFVKDSFKMIEDKQLAGYLSGLEYKDWKILVNTGSASTVSIVAIIKGRENEFLKDDMDEILQNIECSYGAILKVWNGDMTKVKGMEEIIKPLITSGKYDGIDYGKKLADPKLRMNRLYENVLSGLIREAKKQPILIFIDDLQWADQPTLGLLHYLTRNTRSSPILIIGTYRPEDLIQPAEGGLHSLVEQMELMRREDLLHEINLKRFTKSEMLAVLKSHFQNVLLPDAFFNRLYKDTEGNPLFTLEVFKMLIDEKVVEYDKNSQSYRTHADIDIKDIKLPAKIYDVITRRLSKLEKEHRKLLDPAAVEGEYFKAGTIEKILDVNRLKLLDALNTIEQVHKLIRTSDDRFKFDHIKIREVIYNSLNSALRKEYHRLVGKCIEDEYNGEQSVAPILAMHYYLAEDIEKAVPYLMQAGIQAKNDFANKDAFNFFQNALQMLNKKNGDLNLKLECMENLADIEVLVGNYESAIERYKNGLSTANTLSKHLKVAELTRKIGSVYERIGELNKALSYYKDAINIAAKVQKPSQTPPIEIARIYNAISWVHFKKSEYDTAIKYNEKALQISKELDDKYEIALSMHQIGTNYLRKGDYKLALKFLNESLEIREAFDDLRGLSASYNNIGVLYKSKGLLDEALEYFVKSLKIRQKIGDTLGIAAAYNNVGVIHTDRGRFEEALEYFTKSKTICERIGDLEGSARSYSNIGLVYREKEDFDNALKYFLKSLNISEKIGTQRASAVSYNNIGDLYSDKNDWNKAIEFYERSMQICDRIGEKWLQVFNYTGLCRTFAYTGMHKKALEYGEKGYKLAHKIGAKDCIAASNKALAIMHTEFQEWRLAEKHFKKCISMFEEIGRAFEVIKCKKEYENMQKKRKTKKT